MATIDLKHFVAVNPSVLAAVGNALDLNGLVLSASAQLPVGAPVPFSNPADVSMYFGAGSTEYAIAQIYYRGFSTATKLPSKLYFTRYADVALSAFVRGARYTGTLAELKAIPTGDITVSLDATPHTSSTVSLAAATSFSDAATIIGTALAAAVTWDSVSQAFVISSGTTGASSTAGYAAGTLATALKLTSATGAVLSLGADAATPATFMDSVVAQTQNWACFMTTFEPDLANKTLFAAWTNLNSPRYLYAAWDTDVNALTDGSTATFAYALKTAAYEGTQATYGTVDRAAFVLGAWASVDFNRANGRITMAYKTQSGLIPTSLTTSQATALENNGYNYFGQVASTPSTLDNLYYPGSISGTWKNADIYTNQIWMTANFQLSMFRLMQQANNLPYNATGYARIEGSLVDPIARAATFGAIQAGVAPSVAQAQQIQSVLGFDIAPTLFERGWYLHIAPATPAQRAANASPTCTLYYMDGGSIKQLTLASIAVL